MKTQHTKGEWKINIHPTITQYELDLEEMGITSILSSENTANAKLIAAAPILLENLIRCVDRLEENELGDMSAVRRAKEAIKKATK